MGMMGKIMAGIMAKASEKYDVVELDKDDGWTRSEDEKKELTLTEVTYILMNSDIDKIIIIHKE